MKLSKILSKLDKETANKILKIITASNIPDIKVGDVILAGRFKNKRAVVEGFDVDKHNQPVVLTDKGRFNVFKFRLEKLMPKKK